MFKTKLTALNHPSPNDIIDPNDIKQFRSVVLWLEDQKIRFYKIEDRADLRKIDSNDWDKCYVKYKTDLKFPSDIKSQKEELFWLINHAIKLEYCDNVNKFQSISSESVKQSEGTQAPSLKSKNPFDNLDFNTKEFITGVRDLAKKLDIADHPDHLVVLQAISKVIKNTLGTEALKEPLMKGDPCPYEEGANVLPKKSDDQELEHAAKILRLLQIQNVRKLQTGINETIVVIQNITANPKTDTKLGKVGF